MLSGVTHENRHQVSAAINDAVAGTGGWITNHTFFSNIATTFHFTTAPGNFSAFQARIFEAGVLLDDESIAKLSELEMKNSGLPEEIPAALNVTFIHDEPELRREVPAVPG